MNQLNKFYPLLAVSMALLIMISSTGLAVDMHFCQGKLKSINFFGEAKSCHEIAINDVISCKHHQGTMKNTQEDNYTKSKKECCENKFIYLQLDQDQQTYTNEIVLNQQLKQFLTAFQIVFLSGFDHIIVNVVAQKHYKPPLIPKDIPVLIQSFLF